MANGILSPLGEKGYIERGYGQVEPNHLSAQRTGQIYAQLPAKADIAVLENGQFVKYNYAAGEVDFTGNGEWMLVYNEVKVYYDHQADHDFAMVKTNYNGRVYSPIGAETRVVGQARNYADFAQKGIAVDGTANPFTVETFTGPAMMNKNHGQEGEEVRTMVPRVLKTNIGDFYTTNTIAETTLAVGDVLVVGDDGYLLKEENNGEGENAGTMKWEVVKVYTMPDRQRGVKIMRIA